MFHSRIPRPIHAALWLIPAAACGLAALPCLAAAGGSGKPLNVLFIAVDDLRPQLGCYGHPEMVTPNIDRLAAHGRAFLRHYAQVPTCGASRCAMLTGRYPRVPKAYENEAFATLPREPDRAIVSLPQLFHKHGYATASIGKITHSPDGRADDGQPELPFGFDRVGVPAGKWGDGWSAFFAYADGSTRVPTKTPAFEHADVPDDGYPDGLIANEAVARLGELKSQGKPFFLAVGFFKPHLPFDSPKRYWDRYQPDSIPPAKYAQPPKNTDPSISLHKSGELTPRYTGLATPGVVTDAEGETLRRSYAACVSYSDAQVGRVLDELHRLGLDEQTIVVLWGDHGWHLGEYGIWGKHTLYEVALRSPLIIRVPGMAQAGKPTNGLVESVDIYPTLAELCALAPPEHLDGRSLAPQLQDPSSAGKQATYGFWAAGRAHSVRDDRYRFTRWTASGDPERVVQLELYDHAADPDETVNIAAEHPDLVKSMTETLFRVVPVLKAATVP
jgi:arylsulfatase A-like enzyme